ncbi:MAG: type II toxin-antitoxin system VapC family toxin [Acidimicrobiia bacterium]
MPTSAERARRRGEPDVLVDTSAAVALLVADHDLHDATVRALYGRRLGLAGHAAFETFSVLTRLPTGARRPPGVVAKLIGANFPASRFLSVAAAAALLDEFAAAGVAGGSVYDALVGAAAREHGSKLATNDRRALDVYRLLGVEVEALTNR